MMPMLLLKTSHLPSMIHAQRSVTGAAYTRLPFRQIGGLRSLLTPTLQPFRRGPRMLHLGFFAFGGRRSPLGTYKCHSNVQRRCRPTSNFADQFVVQQFHPPLAEDGQDQRSITNLTLPSLCRNCFYPPTDYSYNKWYHYRSSKYTIRPRLLSRHSVC